MGLAYQGDEETTPTVEGRLFQALERCKLITSPDDCQFTRCGRTDRGVSGLGQVVSLRVRSNGEDKQEIGYIDTLNRLLPDDIRVLAWAPVSSDFSARFNCKSRTYKYFFSQGRLDLDAMRLAGQRMLGEHDFRNFCKLDPSKNITNYKRTILSLEIRQVAQPEVAGGAFCEVELKGTAFLWHQVRCIMSILFLVGQGLEKPEVVSELLDVSKVESRPDYPMASELPLLLYECEFEGLNWSPSPNESRVFDHWRSMWADNMTRSLLCRTFLDYMGTTGLMQNAREDTAPAIVLGGGREIKSSRYRALMERPRCDSDQVKKEKYHAKKKQKTSN
ncbi:pseudouridine synthase [Syncephalastrum racemosum]|uniref:Pseudouridine synthase n=1 Tax=Syncephalastrum racemosum TaxID=13706 RepID=A0A1X2HHR6_SYNRA|nr:pseudouridine synthase [Syncephalastrum racemosum]